MSESLKSCPFCGGSNIVSDQPVREDRSCFYYCDDCGGGGAYRKNPKLARAAWNTRPPDALAGRLYEALRKLAKEAKGFIHFAHVDAHGATNIAVLQHWIDNAFAVLAAYEERAK